MPNNSPAAGRKDCPLPECEYPQIAVAFPCSKKGWLPIPKEIVEYPGTVKPYTSRYYWNASEFLKYHMDGLLNLFSSVLKQCIENELKNLPDSKKVKCEQHSGKMSFFPMRATANTTINALSYRTV